MFIWTYWVLTNYPPYVMVSGYSKKQGKNLHYSHSMFPNHQAHVTPWPKTCEWLVAQSCPTLCDPMDCSLSGSSLHGIFQAIVLEWIAISFSRRSSRPRDQTRVSRIVDRRFTIWATREVLIRRKRRWNVLRFWLSLIFSPDLSQCEDLGWHDM